MLQRLFLQEKILWGRRLRLDQNRLLLIGVVQQSDESSAEYFQRLTSIMNILRL